jgi:hypothetical protein
LATKLTVGTVASTAPEKLIGSALDCRADQGGREAVAPFLQHRRLICGVIGFATRLGIPLLAFISAQKAESTGV